MMSWEKLISCDFKYLQRGYLLKFPASEPFEETVIMMVCGYPDDGNRLSAAGLMTITGFCAGINAYVVFPSSVISSGISREWLIKNWNMWVWPDGKIDDVLVRTELMASDL
jgi:hypothetical protein